MDRWAGRIALVTGASTGIGLAVVKRLLEHGVHVVACARNFERLTAIGEEDAVKDAPGEYKPFQCDLREEDEILSLFEFIRSTFNRLDICINNAGLSQNSPLINGSTDHWREMLNVNVLALSICTREAVQLMMSRDIDDGHIINLGSMSGHRVLTNPAIHFYSGTKFMVRALAEGLRQELREVKSRIRVSNVSPGLVETEFTERMLDAERAKEIYSKSHLIQADDVAMVIIDLLKAPNHIEINDVLVRPTEQVF